MNQTQRIRLGLLLTNIKLGGRFSFRTFTADASYPKDPDPKNWRTINGSKVHLTNGKIDGGAGGKFKGNAWVGKKSHGHNSFFPQEQMNYKANYKKKPEVVYEKEPPLYLVNHLKGTFKGLHAGHQQEIKSLIADIKKNGQIPDNAKDGFLPEHHNLVLNTVAALKAKKITPTAAQNIIAKAGTNPSSYMITELNKQWGAQEPPDMATVKAPAKPKVQVLTGQATATQAPVVSEAKIQKIIEDLNTKGDWEQDEYLNADLGFMNSEAEEIMELHNELKEAQLELDDTFGDNEWDEQWEKVKEIKKKLKEAIQKPLEKKMAAQAKAAQASGGFSTLPAAEQKARKAAWDKQSKDPGTKWFDKGTQEQQLKAADVYFKPEHDAWIKASTPEERKGVIAYTGSSYAPINDWLRGEASDISQKNLESIKNADAALAKTENKDTVRLRRGVSTSVLDLIKKSPDGIYTDQGYTSASPCSKGGFHKSVEIEIIVPPGKGQGTWVDPISANQGEAEFVLPRGAQFKVCEIDESGHKPHVKLMLIGFAPKKI